MNSGLAELAACLASLDAMLARMERLVPEYDEKIRKNRHSTSKDIERLENKVSFAELRSIDQLCQDALARWLPQRPELATEWFVNEFKGMASPEDGVNELRQKRVRLLHAIELYKALTTSDSETIRAATDVPSAYSKLGDSVGQFFADTKRQCDVYDKNVFIMTRFQEGNAQLTLIDATIRQSLSQNGLVGHRADDKCYPNDRNLWDNVCTYMFGCRYGVAVLEDIMASEFNPNVALEYGFMRALGKPTLLLKEKRFLPRADILGTLWEEFDVFNIEKTVSSAINRWYRDVT